MNWHVLPVNDLEPHEENTTCKCKPNVIHQAGNMIVVHNSFDGREGVEWAKEILTKNPTSKNIGL